MIVKSRYALILLFAAMMGVLLGDQHASAWPFGPKKQSNTDVASAESKKSSGVSSVRAATESASSAVKETVVVDAKKTIKASPAFSGLNSSKGSTQANDDSLNEDEEKTEVESTPQAVPLIPELPKLPEIPKVPTAKSFSYIPSSAKIGGPASGMPAPSVDPDIVRIQKQIHEIMKINESLSANFSQQAVQMEKIKEQAIIHEKILADLEKSKKIYQEANPENYLNKEKIKLIKAQTDANQKYLEDVKKSSSEERDSLAALPSDINAD